MPHTLPLRKRIHGRSVVGCDSVQYVVIAVRIAHVAVISKEQPSSRRVGVEQDVVLDGHQSRGLRNEQRPPAGRRHVERVVEDLKVPGALRGIDRISGDPARHVVVDQIVADHAVLRSIHIDPGSS